MSVDVKDSTIKDKQNLVLLRAEKLTAALYLVTDFLPDREPIKWRLRDRALSLVSDTSVVSYESAVRKIDQIVSLIDVVITGKLASSMNFSILKKEHLNLKDILLDFSPEPLGSLQDSPVLAGLLASTKEVPTVAKPSKTANKATDNSRKEAILAYVKEKGPASITDVAQAVPGVSSKTVQRELNSLIFSGKVKKEGDRRWSRYTLT